MLNVRNAHFTCFVVISTFSPLAFPSSIPLTESNINPLIPYAMMAKKILDLRNYSGLPRFVVFSDDDTVVRPYSSWDVISNGRRVSVTDMYRRYDVVFSSLAVRDRCLHAISQSECFKAHCVLVTSSCVIHLFDVIEPDIFIDLCKSVPILDNDYLLIIHEVSEAYQIISKVGVEEYGYLSDALTYDRR